MISAGTQSSYDRNRTKETFAYILTGLPLLKHLALSGYDYLYLIESMDPTIINNNVISVTLSVRGYGHWLPLLYRLAKLKSLTIHFIFQNEKRRVASRDSTSYFGCQIQNNIPTDHRFSLRHIRIYGLNMILENFENLFRLFRFTKLIDTELIQLSSVPFTRFPLPRRKTSIS